MKKTTKKAAKVAPAPKSQMVGVSRPIPSKPVTVLGIDFEQGDTYKFGKCVHTGAPNRVWTFILFDGEYILFSRHPHDLQMDVSRIAEQQFPHSYQVVDFDTPTTPGAPQGAQNIPQPVGGFAAGNIFNVGQAWNW